MLAGRQSELFKISSSPSFSLSDWPPPAKTLERQTKGRTSAGLGQRFSQTYACLLAGTKPLVRSASTAGRFANRKFKRIKSCIHDSGPKPPSEAQGLESSLCSAVYFQPRLGSNKLKRWNSVPCFLPSLQTSPSIRCLMRVYSAIYSDERH